MLKTRGFNRCAGGREASKILLISSNGNASLPDSSRECKCFEVVTQVSRLTRNTCSRRSLLVSGGNDCMMGESFFESPRATACCRAVAEITKREGGICPKVREERHFAGQSTTREVRATDPESACLDTKHFFVGLKTRPGSSLS